MATSRQALRCRVRSPGWEELTTNVIRLTAFPDSFAQRCMAGALDVSPAAVVSRVSAACLWGLAGFSPSTVHVTRPTSACSRRSHLAIVHESRYLPAHHCTHNQGVPVTTLTRTLFDLAGVLHPARTERALENALKYRMVSLEDLRRVTVELLARGRRGSTLMRALLEARGVGYIPPASGFEADFLSLLVAADLPLPEGQVNLGGALAWIGRVDFYYRLLRLVIEVDSDLHHSAKLDVESDRRRDRALRQAGFSVLRITESQLRDRPDEVVALLQAALGNSQQLTPPAVPIGATGGVSSVHPG